MKWTEITYPTDEDAEQTYRFRTYVNYLSAVDKYLAEQFNHPSVLVESIMSSRQYQSIQGGRCSDTESLSRILRNAWFTEIQMRISAPADELVPYSNHWAPVQLYYCVYLALKAFFLVTDHRVGDNHSSVLSHASAEIVSRPALFPYPWKVLCGGDPDKKTEVYRNLPSGIKVEKVSSLTSSQYLSFWDSYCMLLRTTRERQIEKILNEWKRKNKRKRIIAAQRAKLLNGYRETSLFDALYRLRIRSNYIDADAFLLSLQSMDDSKQFNKAIQKICWHTLLLLETIIMRYIGKDKYSIIVHNFHKHDKGNISDTLVCRRLRHLERLYNN